MLFRCSQCSPLPTGWDSWIQVSGLYRQMKRISAHGLYYVMITLVCKTHSRVTMTRISKTFSEIAENSQNMV